MSKVRDYINENISIADVYFEHYNRSIPVGKLFCPFHANTDTPAAKRYGNHIHCFTCKRNYTVYDFLFKFNPIRIKEIKSSVIMDEVRTTNKPYFYKNIKVSRDLPIKKVLDSILNQYENGSEANN